MNPIQAKLGAGSGASLSATALTIRLDRSLFRPAFWEQLRTWFSGTANLAWLQAPWRVMSAPETAPGSPRWKAVTVDLLSWLVFLLMVPVTHPLVALWQAVDWAAINRLCAPCYKNSARGQCAWAPAQLLALLLLFFVVPLASETALIQTVAIVPLYRWFCGFGLFSPLPDHSTLYTFRRRLGAARLEAILTWVVQQCLQRKLISNDLALFDMMGVVASAHPWTPYERAVLLTHALIRYLELAEAGHAPAGDVPTALRQLAAESALAVLDNERLQQDPQAPSRILKSLARWQQRRQGRQGQPLWEAPLEEAVQAILAAESAASPAATETPPLGERLKQVAQQLKERLPHARGDRDARIGRVSEMVLKCGYWLGFLVDARRFVITAVRVVPLNVSQQTQLPAALDAHQERVAAYPQAVAADSAQDYYPVHQALDQRQIVGHIASRQHHGAPRKDGLVPYTATAACATCQRKTECLPKGQQPDGPRRISLEPAAHQRWLQNREHTRTAAYKEAQSRRFASEGLFGLARRVHGADKMPYRSLAMNLIAGLLIGTAIDLAILAKAQQDAAT